MVVERAGQRRLVPEHRRRALADHDRVGLAQPHERRELAHVPLEIRPGGNPGLRLVHAHAPPPVRVR